jgi:hypothetical protein
MAIFWRAGRKPANPVNQTNACDDCEPTLATMSSNLGTFDTERDAAVAWRLFRGHIVATWGRKAWDELWTNFQCTNQQCNTKKPCGNRPLYVEVGADVFRAPRQPARFKLYLTLAREIQCVKAATPPGDVVPVLPDPETKVGEEEGEGEGVEPGSEGEKGKGKGDKKGSDKSPKMKFLPPDELEFRPIEDVLVEFLNYEEGPPQRRER